MKFCMRALACAVIGSSVTSASGNYTWTPKAEDPDNLLTNAVHFSPALGDDGIDGISAPEVVEFKISASADPGVSVKVPVGMDFVSSFSPCFRASAGKTFLLDAAGASWRQPDIPTGSEYPNSLNPSRFRILFGDSYAMTYRNSDKTKGAFSFRDGKIIVSNKVGGVSLGSIGFLGGTFDFFSPNGADNKNCDFLVTGFSAADITRWTVSDGASLRLPKVYLYSGSPTNEWNFLSGTNYVHVVNLRSFKGDHDDDYIRTRINVLGEGTAFTTTELADYVVGGEETCRQGCRILIAQGGSLLFPSSSSGNIIFTEPANRELAYFVFDGGRLDILQTMDWQYAKIYATNSVFSTQKITFRSGSLKLKDTRWDAHGKRVTFGYEKLGAAHCEIDGGTYSFGALYVGQKTGIHTFAVSNGTVDVSCAVDADFGLSIGGAGSAAYATSDSEGRFYLSGGTLKVGTLSTHPVIIGGLGDGLLDVSGGTLEAGTVKLMGGSAATEGRNAVYRQRGGDVAIAGNVELAASKDATDCTALVALEGGALTAKAVVGGAGCSAVDAAKSSVATLRGNGGILRAASASDNFIGGLNKAECGAAALRIESAHAIVIPQSFSDMDGEEGELVLAGSGSKTLSGVATTVSRIVAAGGSLAFAPGAKASSALVVTNGAKVIFGVSPRTLGLASVTVGDGETAGVLDLSVESPLAFGDAATLDFNNVLIDLAGKCSAGDVRTLATASGSVSAGTAAAWRAAVIRSCEDPTLSYVLTTEEKDGETLFNVSVVEAERTIDLAVDESMTITDPIVLGNNSALLANVASNAVLTIEAGVSGGAIVKRGSGKIVIGDAVNVLNKGIFCEEGIVSVRDVSALSGAAAVIVADGTFEFKREIDDDGPQTMPCPLVCRASMVYADGVSDLKADTPGIIDLKIESPLKITDVAMESGCIFKRGAGTLVFAPRPGETMKLSMHEGTRAKNYNGTSKPRGLGDVASDYFRHPKSGYSGFNVAEGGVLIVGDASSTVKIDHTTMISVSASGVRVPASLTFDGVKGTLASGSAQQISLGCYVILNGYGTASYPKLTICNGADVMTAGMKTHDESAYVRPTSIVDNATWRFANNVTPYGNGSPYEKAAFIFRNGARGYLGGNTAINVYASGDNDFIVTDGSVLAKNESLDGFEFKLNQKATKGGVWTLGENSTVALSAIKYKMNSGPMKVELDGGTWLAAQNTLRLHNSWDISLETLRDEGVNFPVGAGRTNYIARAICGAGGVVKTGAGVLRFEAQAEWESADSSPRGIISNLTDSVSLAFDGPLDVREGTVLVDEGCCRTGGAYRTGEGAVVDFGGNNLGSSVVFSGAGTFANATVGDCVISVPLEKGEAPNFADVGFDGRIRVKFGTVGGIASAVTVATFDGEMPDVSGFYSSGIGNALRAKFYVDGNAVKADIYKSSVMLIVR